VLYGHSQEPVNPIRNKPAKRARQEYKQDRAHQTASQLVQMFQERHLAAEFFFLALARGEWSKKRRHQGFVSI
jgi:hypothetical protein